jgi:hypothetical protein
MVPYPGCESAKRCAGCKFTFHVAQFPFVSNNSDGRSTRCIHCHERIGSPLAPSRQNGPNRLTVRRGRIPAYMGGRRSCTVVGVGVGVQNNRRTLN